MQREDKQQSKLDDSTTIEDLKLAINLFVKERNWDRFQNLRSLAISLSLESNEFLDHFQWFNDKEVEEFEQDKSRDEEVAEELCDILAYLLIAANRMNIDVADAFFKKLEKNRQKYPAENFKDASWEEDNNRYQELRKRWELRKQARKK